MPDSKFMFHTGTFSGEFTGTQIDTDALPLGRLQDTEPAEVRHVGVAGLEVATSDVLLHHHSSL